MSHDAAALEPSSTPASPPGGPSILFLNHNFIHRATYFRNFNLARVLAARGWRSTLLTVSERPRLVPRHTCVGGVELVETPWWLGPPVLAENGCCPTDILFRCAWVLARHYDVTIVSDHLPNVSLPFLASRLFNRSRIYHADWADLFTFGGCHRGWNRGLRTPCYALSHALEVGVKRLAHSASATSRRLRDLLHAHCGKAPAQTLFLPSGSSLDRPFEAATGAARARLGIACPGLLVGRTGRTGIAGRLSPEEISAFLALRTRCIALGLPPAALYLVGDHRAEWYPALADAGVHLLISGLLPPDQVVPHLEACDLFLLMEADTPFNRHRGPIRLNDYLSAGRPVLCNSVGDHARFLEERGAGVIWDNLGAAPPTLDILLRDPETRANAGRKARQIAETDWSWETLGSQLDRFLRGQCLAAAGGPHARTP